VSAVAKPIVVSHEGKTSTFAFSKLDRKKLYAWRRRVVLDRDAQPCIRAELTRDGSMLIRANMTAQGYFTEEGRWVPNADLVGLDEEGQPTDKKPSTLGETQMLEGPVPPEDLLDLAVQAVYVLDSTELDSTLEKAVKSGAIYRFPFNYRTDYHASTAYLVANEEGWFAVVGDATYPTFCGLEEPAVESFETEEGLDLDFEMF
jgi:hypothetical protein